MIVEIINVGTEIILGNIVNTNSKYISEKMAELGFDVYYHTSVGDNAVRVGNAVKTAFSRSHIVIMTGGLGPTNDDLTKKTIFDLLEMKTVIHTETMKNIEKYFRKIGKEMDPCNENQALFPVGAEIFKNEIGTAPGCAVKSKGKTVILLPGPPYEMTEMFESQVAPYLRQQNQGAIISKTFKVTGMGETQIEKVLEKYMENSNPTIGLYAKLGYVEVRATLKSYSEREARTAIKPIANTVAKLLGSSVIVEGDRSIEEELVSILRNNNKTISFCESCTGGRISDYITNVSGASEVLEFSQVTYSGSKKKLYADVNSKMLRQFGEVSMQVAGQMAIGTRYKSKSDFSMGITGIAGPTGGTAEKPVGTVYISICDNENIVVKHFLVPSGTRNEVKERIAISAMDMAIRYMRKEEITKSEFYRIKEFKKMTGQKNKHISKTFFSIR